MGAIMPTLVTGDLLLEPLVAAHAEAMFAVLSDPALFRFIDGAPPGSVHELRQRYARLESRMSPDGAAALAQLGAAATGRRAAGFVQSTVEPDRQAWVAYLLGQQHQGRCLGLTERLFARDALSPPASP
jgi:RimJ/RimL family protein N-acetyltransferase